MTITQTPGYPRRAAMDTRAAMVSSFAGLASFTHNRKTATETEHNSMTQIKTPEQIADAELRADDNWTQTADPALVREMLVRAIEADRAQRQPEIYIVQNGGGDVVGVFRDSDEAAAAYGDRFAYSIVAETVSEPGEYAKSRIEDLTREWGGAVNWGADEPVVFDDYNLSEDDLKAGLEDDEAAEIVRLIEWAEAQK